MQFLELLGDGLAVHDVGAVWEADHWDCESDEVVLGVIGFNASVALSIYMVTTKILPDTRTIPSISAQCLGTRPIQSYSRFP